MSARILYEETCGAGFDEENSRHADGIWVRLSKWESESVSYNSPPEHYIIEEIVMVDRKIVRNENKVIFNSKWEQEAVYIRAAIERMNSLALEYPQCDPAPEQEGA